MPRVAGDIDLASASTDGPKRWVLVVEDDDAVANLLDTLLSELGCAVRVARTGHQALEMAAGDAPSLVILDLGLPGLYGTSVGVTLRHMHPKLPLIIVSALPDSAVAQDAWSVGAQAYFTKPFDCDQLLAKARELIEARAR